MFSEFVQNYAPIGNTFVSAIFAALPIFVLLIMLGILRTAAHWAAAAALLSAVLVALIIYGMPLGLTISATAYGAAYGLWPIAWIVLNAIFIHNLTVETGVFDVVRSSLSSNSLFGPMQVVTAQQLGINPVIAGATNSSGGVMGKMISPQNLTVGASAIGQVGKESDIFRMTFKRLV